MRKLLTWAILPIFFFCIFFAGLAPDKRTVSAQAIPAQGGYACILSDSAYFYSSPDERRGIFLLPKTYYIKLLSYGENYCKIEYLTDDSRARKLVGYAKTQDLTFVDYTPLRPYLYYVFDVKYRIEDSEIIDDSFLTEITVTCVYYGDYKIGSECYCYVLRGEEFGYIPKPSSLVYEENSEYADYVSSLTSDSSSSAPVGEPSGFSPSPVQIAILVALCLLVPVLAALILKPPRRPPYELDD